jgi:hypothetical protein
MTPIVHSTRRCAAVWSAPRVGRRLNIPLWAVMVVAAWLSLIGLREWFESAGSGAPSMCHAKAITGIACPTCGTTRAVRAAAAGDVLGAWLMNPFVVTAILCGLLWLTWRLSTGRTISVRLTKPARNTICFAVAFLFVLNWVYLIVLGI